MTRPDVAALAAALHKDCWEPGTVRHLWAPGHGVSTHIVGPDGAEAIIAALEAAGWTLDHKDAGHYPGCPACEHAAVRAALEGLRAEIADYANRSLDKPLRWEALNDIVAAIDRRLAELP